jgi:hypothetical protein
MRQHLDVRPAGAADRCLSCAGRARKRRTAVALDEGFYPMAW